MSRMTGLDPHTGEPDGRFAFVTEIATVAGVIGVCATLVLVSGSSALRRAAGAEWFSLARTVQIKTVENFALTGEWSSAEAPISAAGNNGTRCFSDREIIRCEMQDKVGQVIAALNWVPATTEGALNWACVKPDNPDVADASQWFHVCRNSIHSVPPSKQGH